MTPLMRASVAGHVDIVKILIGAKADINKQDKVSTHCTTHCHNVVALLSSVTVYRWAGLLFNWQLKKAKLMW